VRGAHPLVRVSFAARGKRAERTGICSIKRTKRILSRVITGPLN